MLYLSTAPTVAVRARIAAGELGQLLNPKVGHRLVEGATFAVDNGSVRLEGGRPIPDPDWRPDPWLRLLDRYAGRPGCLFAAVPDHVGDAARTDALWHRWRADVADRGYRPAYVTQNGASSIPDDAGAIFTGGDDTWKLGPDARRLVDVAGARGLWRHMGRVNTKGRLLRAVSDGYDSVDGTKVAFGDRRNLPELLRWVRQIGHPALPGIR